MRPILDTAENQQCFYHTESRLVKTLAANAERLPVTVHSAVAFGTASADQNDEAAGDAVGRRARGQVDEDRPP